MIFRKACPAGIILNLFNLEALKRLKPVFKKDGTVTAGNASGINDGAAAVALMSEKEAEKRKLKKLVSIKSWTSCGVDPALMGTGPIPASKKALDLAGWSIKDIDLFEINEAFASVPLRYMNDLEIDYSVTNVNGGAIAMGHPLGATGAVLVSTMLDELERRDLNIGMMSLCVGGGMGISCLIERV